MRIDREQLCALIPHDGAMCLLDSVRRWDVSTIECTAISHRDENNPLRRDGMLPAVCGVEYGAQAMAVHGGLLAGDDGPRVGYLASVRDVQINVQRLDLCGELRVRAECLMNNENTQMYEFTLHDGDELLLSGRAAVFLQEDVPS